MLQNRIFSDDADLLLFMKQRGVWKEFQQGDVITSETGPFYGIHLIIRGIVKVRVNILIVASKISKLELFSYSG